MNKDTEAHLKRLQEFGAAQTEARKHQYGVYAIPRNDDGPSIFTGEVFGTKKAAEDYAYKFRRDYEGCDLEVFEGFWVEGRFECP